MRIHQPLDARLADIGQLGDGDGREVGHDRHRLAVEVTAGDDAADLREYQRVVGDAVDLDLQHAANVRQRVAHRAVHLRHAADRIRVLHPRIVGAM